MAACPSCGADIPEGHRFCGMCGRAVAPAPPPSGPSPAPDIDEGVPAALTGRASRCRRCNSLISAAAVICPVCLGPVGTPVAAAGAVAVPP